MSDHSKLGFTPRSSIIEEQYKSMRTADNIAPAVMPRLLLVISNLGFPKPVVTVGGEKVSATSLQLDDYLRRGADPKVPVSVQLSWTEADGSVNRVAVAAEVYDAFANGLWFGFGAVAAAVYPNKPITELRELAFEQMPALADSFDLALATISEKGLALLGSE